MEEAKKTPLIRLSKRDAMDPKKVWAIRIGSILVALIIGCIPILITGNNPFKAYVVIIKGSLGTSFYFKQTIKNAIPLLGCALAIAPRCASGISEEKVRLQQVQSSLLSSPLTLRQSFRMYLYFLSCVSLQQSVAPSGLPFLVFLRQSIIPTKHFLP